MTSPTLVIRGISELATCDPGRGPAPGVVRDAALVARDGVVVFAGPEADLDRSLLVPGATVLDAGGRAVVPGFVDSHTHAVWLGDRSHEYELRAAGASYEEIAASGGGIRSTVAATAAGGVDELAAAALPRLRRMLAGGTTTVEVKSGYGGAIDAEIRQLEAAARLAGRDDCPDVVTTYLPLHGPAPAARTDLVDAVCQDGLPRAAAAGARFADAFCEEGAWSVEECERVLTEAGRHGLRAKVHAEQRTHLGGAALAARLGAVSADHLEHADDGDVRALAAAGVVAVILPGASLVLGGDRPPGRRLLDLGCRVAVATDCNPGTCYSESMPLMTSLAVHLAGLTPGEALVAATSGGAAALALTDRGALAPGMRCDAVVLDSAHWVDVAYHLGADPVAAVVRAGLVVSGRI